MGWLLSGSAARLERGRGHMPEWGCEKPTILSDRRQLLRPPLNCRASGFVQSTKSHVVQGLGIMARPKTLAHKRRRGRDSIYTHFDPLLYSCYEQLHCY